jgi:MFS family permease
MTGAPSGLFAWWSEADTRARRALIAASLGWMLDAFDIMLFALLTASVINELGLTKPEAGALGSITLLGSAAGGLLFGVIADRYGRTRALMGSVLVYSIFTALCGFTNSFWQLAVVRALLGLGMGGEWASGAALVSESYPARHRGKALGYMQSSWAIGDGLAAFVTWLVLPQWGWRAAFFVGVLPALFTLWVRRNVQEPEIWLRHRESRAREPAGKRATSYADVFRDGRARLTVAITLMNAFTLFGWWGLNGWVPARLSLSIEQGGLGMSAALMSKLIIVNQIGMWLGYVTFGYVADAFGRKRTYIVYLIAASVLLPLYGFVQSPSLLLALGPVVMFFGTGHFSGFGPLSAELYPTAIRARAQGLTYNLGRIASAAAPFAVGTLAATRGFGTAFIVTGVAFTFAALSWIWIPETKGRELA